MVYPTIHLNGTSKDRLLEDIEKAYAAINAALNEHLARQQKLQDVLLELQDLAEHIDAGGNR
jgi:hypothetical protein